jgi:hypothetical protein
VLEKTQNVAALVQIDRRAAGKAREEARAEAIDVKDRRRQQYSVRCIEPAHAKCIQRIQIDCAMSVNRELRDARAAGRPEEQPRAVRGRPRCCRIESGVRVHSQEIFRSHLVERPIGPFSID